MWIYKIQSGKTLCLYVCFFVCFQSGIWDTVLFDLCHARFLLVFVVLTKNPERFSFLCILCLLLYTNYVGGWGGWNLSFFGADMRQRTVASQVVDRPVNGYNEKSWIKSVPELQITRRIGMITVQPVNHLASSNYLLWLLTATKKTKSSITATGLFVCLTLTTNWQTFCHLLMGPSTLTVAQHSGRLIYRGSEFLRPVKSGEDYGINDEYRRIINHVKQHIRLHINNRE